MSRATKGRFATVGFLAAGIVIGWIASNAEVKHDIPAAPVVGNTAMATENTDATFRQILGVPTAQINPTAIARATVAAAFGQNGSETGPVDAGGRAEAEPSTTRRQQRPGATSTPSGTPTHPSERNARVGVAALVLPNIRWNKEQALKRIESYVRRAAALGAKIVVTPETCLDGYVCHQPGLTREKLCTLAEYADGQRMDRLRRVARELDLYLCVGFSELENDQLYNSAILIGPDGKTVGKYRKTHGVEQFYQVGDALPVFETRYGKVGIMICYDRQLPETARTLAAQGAELILIPSNGMWGRMNNAMLRTRAYENGVFLVFAHPRDGLVIDPGGRIIAANVSVPGQGVGVPTNTDTEDAGGWPEAVVREIDLQAWRQSGGNLQNRRSNLYLNQQAISKP